MTGFDLLFPAFIAGFLTFFAPCTLPLVPSFLAFLVGGTSADHSHQGRYRLVAQTVWYILGFSIVFIIFGAFFGFIGSHIVMYRSVLTRLGGVFIVFLGLFLVMSNVRPEWLSVLQKDYRLQLPQQLHPGTPLAAVLFGAIFAFGWTPCIGPILATILFFASTSGTVLSGIVLLAVFSAGLAIPFLLSAMSIEFLRQFLKQYSSVLRWVQFVSGVILLLIGILLLCNQLDEWARLFYLAFPFLRLPQIDQFF